MNVYVAFEIDDGFSAEQGEAAAQFLVDQCPVEVGAVLTFAGIEVRG